MIEIRRDRIDGEPLWGWRVERFGEEREGRVWNLLPRRVRQLPQRVGGCGLDYVEACRIAVEAHLDSGKTANLRVLPDHPAKII